MEYVIVQMNPDGVTIDGYWEGASFTANIDTSEVYTSIEDARQAQGSIQVQDTSFDVRYRQANVTIALV